MKKFLTYLTFWRAVLGILLAAGLYATYVRFTQGLGAATNLSDQFPWGLWIDFDILCGVCRRLHLVRHRLYFQHQRI